MAKKKHDIGFRRIGDSHHAVLYPKTGASETIGHVKWDDSGENSLWTITSTLTHRHFGDENRQVACEMMVDHLIESGELIDVNKKKESPAYP